ncbi:MAG: 7-cyano-7-deazaguanine synthase QueC [Planctomycetota bacterium]
MARRAVVLTSGGLDSATVLAIARAEGYEVTALTFRYGQTHSIEVERARVVARQQHVAEHLVLDLPLGVVGGSALLGDGEIPDEPAGVAGSGTIPTTYVPARNLIFLALAVAVGEARSARDLFLGVNAVDFSGYPDCRPEFIESFARTANLGTRDGATHDEPWFRVHMPLVDLRKSEIILRGSKLGVDYSTTVSCYRADALGRACGRCDSCGIRRRGFAEAGLADPTAYQSSPG